MDEEAQRKIVEGLTLLLEDAISKTEDAISNEYFADTKFNIRFSKKVLSIVCSLNFFPTEESSRLQKRYYSVVKDAESVFVQGKDDYERDRNTMELMNVLR